MTIRLSPNARRALSREITNHPDWTNAFRTARNYSLATMTRDDYLAVAREFGIDVQSIVDRVAREESSQPVQDHHKVERAKRVFDIEALGLRAGADIEPPHHLQRALAERSERKAQIERGELEAQSPEFKRAYEPAQPAPRSNGHDTSKAGQLAALLADLAGSGTVNADQVRAIVTEQLAPVLAKLASTNPTIQIELTRQGEKVAEIEGHKHPKLATLLRACTSREVSGFAPNVWIAGPAGSGKTFSARQVAKSLGLAFHFNGAIGMAHELLGFIDANGVYHRTPFREAYENGGVYLFDEVDGSDNAALLALNAALANGVATFPDGQIVRHADCIIIATGNTWGLGGTSDYVGRSKIDAAFLDRFGIKIQWNYDEELERNTCGNPDFARQVQAARAKARSAGLKVLITPRASIAGAAQIAAGASFIEAAELTYLANLTDEQKRMVS